jgi:uncharacterized membrane protein YfhO
VRQATPGYWVIGATLDRDWIAKLDGAATAIVPSDLVRRAVWVPAGEHRVTLRYRPVLQLSLFAASLLLTLGLSAAAVYLLRHPSTRTPGAAI